MQYKSYRNKLKTKYHHLQQKIERAIKNGRFYQYTKHRQKQLLKRLARYQKRLLRAGQLAVPVAGLLVTSTSLSQAQTFTKVTTTASPFINLDIDSNAPFGLSDVGSNSSPTFVDIDGDGDLDAFIGNSDGNTIYYENIATTTDQSNPVFSTPLTNPFGLSNVILNAASSFVDIDGDGDLDAFIGNYYGNTIYFENTSTNSSIPAFTTPLTNPFGLSNVASDAAPSFVDIDGDGDLDAFIGEFDGNTIYFENTSTNSSVPAFTTPLTNPFGLDNVVSYTAPTFADIDGDGDFDAFIGNYNGNIFYYENTDPTTDQSNPMFSTPIANPFGLINVGSNVKPGFVDIDSDGDLDVFIGERYGNINYFENTSTNSSVPAFLETVVDVGLNASPNFVDIDGDGDLDAFIGERNGSTIYYKNTDPTTDQSNPVFSSPIANPFGLSNVVSYAAPSFVDLDLDGDLDAFIGNGFGNIFYYENIDPTTDQSNPTFSSPLANPFGLINIGGNVKPSFVDIDGDGDLDAFIGERDNGNTIYFENTSTNSSIPAFTTPLTNPFGLTSVISRSSPSFIDVDNDGDLDAFIGNSSGNIFYYENTDPTTNKSNPIFSTPIVNPFGLSDVGSFASPSFADLDNDNLLEAIIGNQEGQLTYFESNIRANAAITPLLTYCEQSGTTNPFDNLNISTDASPKIVDVNGNGNLDLISGAGDGTILYFQNNGSNNFIAQTGASNPFNGLDAGSNSKPELVNVDGDSDLDLIVGAYDGTIVYYENVGGNTFTLRSGTDNPFNGIDVGSNSSPQLVNVDSDSDLDLIVGSALTGIFYYENDGSNNFTQQTGTNNPFDVVTGANLTPQLIDVDGDMDLDLIIGNNTGTILYYENGGSNNFTQQTGTNNPFDGFDVGLFSIPHLADVDGDMDLDLLVGDQSGDISYFQNALLSVTASTVNCTNNQGEVALNITSDLFGPYTISNAFSGSVGTADTLGANTTLATGISTPGTYVFEVSASNGCAQVATTATIDENCVFKPDLDDNMTYTGMQTQEQCGFKVIRSTATVNAPFNLTYSATDSVILKPGFQALAGSTFRARIGDCLTPSIVDKPIENRSAEQTEVTLDDFIDERTLLSVFPIPATTHLYYKIEQMEDVEAIYLFDMLGRLVREERDLDGEIDISDLPNGQYALVLIGKEERIHCLVQKQ